jgi:hypothetical protein
MPVIGTKTSRVLLPSAARTASTASQVFTDPDAAALRLYLTLTAVPGGAGLAVVIRGYDKASGGKVELTTGGSPVSQVGTYAYEMCFAPDPAFGNIREAVSRPVPYQWDALVKHFDGQSYTYSLSAEVLK